ncbi:MAG TPA: hypothetical protein VKK31_30255 [Thermoanaerobaculia bacterium]|nr:hypothetical protein [Thermoanaerobaculia bacterium]
MQKSQVEIVKNAERLALSLQAGPTPVKSKNAFLSVVATFMSDPSGDLPRLRRTLALLKQGNGGHLKRGGGFGDQVRMVIGEVGRLLDGAEWEAAELKSLFGWTARLLLVRQERRIEKEPEFRTERDDRKDTRQGRAPQPPRGRPGREEKKSPAPPASAFRAASGKNLAALEALKKKLSGPDGEGS